MSLCTNCGVEVEKGLSHCPLCRSPVWDVAAAEGPRAAASGSAIPPRATEDTPALLPPGRTLRRWLFEAVTLLAAAGASVVLAADFAYRMTLSWSPYPLAAIAFAWVSAVAVIASPGRPLVWLPVQTVALVAFLYVIDLLAPGRSWFAPLALPAALLAIALVAGVVVFARRCGRSPLPTIAVAVLAAGLYLLALELLISRFASRALYPGWSLVAFGCILPVVLVLLVLHRWLRRHPEVRRLFHV
jgi:hypothetical protein